MEANKIYRAKLLRERKEKDNTLYLDLGDQYVWDSTITEPSAKLDVVGESLFVDSSTSGSNSINTPSPDKPLEL